MAYAYRHDGTFGFDDRQGLLLFPGLALELSAARGPLHSAISVRGYPSLGSMSAASFDYASIAILGVRSKTVLEREGYFYGYGFTHRAEAEVGLEPFALRGELAYAWLSSIEGLDRAQELVNYDVHLSETALEYGASAWLVPEGFPLQLGLSFEVRRRFSEEPTAKRVVGGRRVLANMGLRL